MLLAACGGSGSKSGPATLNLWVFQEPSGSFTDAAKRCSQQSGGRYKIVFNALSNDADQQRQSLVRRLAAKDSSIDIAGMDVVWTAEFAEAGWIKPWPAAEAATIRRGTLAGPLRTATYKGRLWAAPANTNTQLLWYRKDLVSNPATTWDGLIDQASKPTLASLYDDASFKKAYPFSDLIRSQVGSGAVRPQTPAYADVSLAIAKTVSPPSNIQLNGFVNDLRSKPSAR